MQATLLSIPLDLGAQQLGVDMGPQALRYAGIKEKLENVGLRIVDAGTIRCRPRTEVALGRSNLKYLDEIVRVAEETAQVVERVIKDGHKIIALGGDHSLSIGTVAGASSALLGDLGLIYIDAHGDFNTDKTTISGNIHGMSLSALTGIGAKELTHAYTKDVKIHIENAFLIGVTNVDKLEGELIKAEKLPYFDMADILAKGLGPLFTQILQLGSSVKNIWVSLDLDVIDGVYAPGVGIPNKGGLTYREIVAIAKFIGQKCQVVGIDIVEYNPMHDIEHKTADLAIELAANLLGHEYNSYIEYIETQK